MSASKPILRTKILDQPVRIYRRYTREVRRRGATLGHVKIWGRDRSGERKWIVDLSPDLQDGSLEELITVIHELMHVADWGRDEIHIDRSSEDIARTLWRLGYRKSSQDATDGGH